MNVTVLAKYELRVFPGALELIMATKCIYTLFRDKQAYFRCERCS